MAEGVTDRFEVINQRLEQAHQIGLSQWLADQREAKHSWQTIAFEIWTLTKVQVNPETLRRWHTRRAQAGS